MTVPVPNPVVAKIIEGMNTFFSILHIAATGAQRKSSEKDQGFESVYLIKFRKKISKQTLAGFF